MSGEYVIKDTGSYTINESGEYVIKDTGSYTINENDAQIIIKPTELIGNTTFTSLTDTPTSYIGNANKLLAVKSTEDGVEFTSSPIVVDWGEIYGTLSDQTDLQNELDTKINHDGTTDLTGDWTISTNNITLTSGTLTANELTDGGVTITDGKISNADYILFNTSFEDGVAEGRLQWNSEDGTLEFGMPGSNVNLQLGQEVLVRVKNTTGSTISNGSVVYISDASGNRPEISLADASSYDTSFVAGVATEDIDTQGYITLSGIVRDVNTDGMAAGSEIWLSETAGGFTTTRPTSPNMSVLIGYVLRESATEGTIIVRPTLVPRLIGLSDVYTETPADNEILQYNNTNTRFELTDSPTFITVTSNLVGNVTGNVTGDLTGDVTGTLNGIDNTKISKLYQPDETNAFVYTDNSGILHIDGNITASGYNEDVIDHNSLYNYLIEEHRVINDTSTTATDLWSANKINTELGTKQDSLVSGTNIKTINSESLLGSGDISLQTPLVSGTDYEVPLTFSTGLNRSINTITVNESQINTSGLNNDEGFITGINSSDVTTALGYTPENLANKGQNNGYASLDSGGKIPITQLPSSIMDFKGTWDASTNTPTLADGTGNNGDVYLCSAAGTQNLGSGNITFSEGDWVVYNGSIWQKSINSNAVVSVNGQQGVVSLGYTELTGTPSDVITAGDNLSWTGSTLNAVNTTYSTSDFNHDDLSGLNVGDYQHLSSIQKTDLTDSGNSSLHYHSSDRDRSNHTGTQTASTISDFDTEVSNNADVYANTSARHDAVTVTDSTELDFTLTGQNITASLKTGSIDETKLNTSVNDSLDLADSALQNLSGFDTGDLSEGTNLYYTDTRVSNNPSVVANTAKRSYPLIDENKLANIEENANNYSLPIASSTLGGVKSGTDITVDASGNVSVNDDSHNHIISNIDGLQDSLDSKITSREGVVTIGSGYVDTRALIANNITTAGNANGFEYNILLNAQKKGITVTQSGSGQISNPYSLFDGMLSPSYSSDGVNPSDPFVLLIEGLPSTHTQTGGVFGWTSRYWNPTRYKIEAYDNYSAHDWVTWLDRSAVGDAQTAKDLILPLYGAGGVGSGEFTKIRITIYDSNGNTGVNGYRRWGLSEIYFIHPEAARTYANARVGWADTLWTPRNINGIAFDGSSDITITANPNSHTHIASDITDFDTEVSNNSSVVANTAKISFDSTSSSKLEGIEAGAEVNNISDANAIDLTDGGATTLHKHSYNNLDDKPSIPTQYTNELAQDAIGTILLDSSEIDFTYNDTTPSITASLIAGSIDETKLNTSVNDSLDLADSALQSGDNVSELTNDSGYISGITGENIEELSNVTITTPADNELLSYDSTSGEWINQTPTEAGFATVATSGAYSDLSGTPTASSYNHDDLSNISGTVGEYNHPTDAQMVVIGNTSGTNTGDQDSIVGISGTKAQFDTALTDGNFAYSGGAFHDGFSDYVANEHIDWTNATSNFNTTGSISVNGTEIVGTDSEVNASVIEDKFLRNDGNDTTSGKITAANFEVTGDNNTNDSEYVPMVLHGTDATPPTASGFPQGTIYIQYTN